METPGIYKKYPHGNPGDIYELSPWKTRGYMRNIPMETPGIYTNYTPETEVTISSDITKLPSHFDGLSQFESSK